MTRQSEIKKRAAAASPGPWRFDPEGWRNRVRQNEVFYDSVDNVHSVKVCEVLHTNDGPFIAHAREDVLWLLAQLEAAQKVVEAARRRIARCSDHTPFRGPCLDCGSWEKESNKDADIEGIDVALAEYDAAQREEKRR